MHQKEEQQALTNKFEQGIRNWKLTGELGPVVNLTLPKSLTHTEQHSTMTRGPSYSVGGLTLSPKGKIGIIGLAGQPVLLRLTQDPG